MEVRHPLLLCAVVFLTLLIIISSGCIFEITATPIPDDQNDYTSEIPLSSNTKIIQAYYQDPTGYIIKNGYESNHYMSSRADSDKIFPVIVFYFHNTISSEPESEPTSVDCNMYPGTDLANQTIQMNSDAMKNDFVWISSGSVVIRDPTITFGELKQVFDADKHVVVIEHRLPAEEYDRLFSSIAYDPNAHISAIPDSFKKNIIQAYYKDPTGYIIKNGYESNHFISSKTYPGTDTIFPVIGFYFHNTPSSEPESKPTRIDCNIYQGTDLVNQTIQMKSDAMKNGFVWTSMGGVFIRDPTITFGELKQVFKDKHVVVCEHRLPAEEYDQLFS
jgi:hypothetical protein